MLTLPAAAQDPAAQDPATQVPAAQDPAARATAAEDVEPSQSTTASFLYDGRATARLALIERGGGPSLSLGPIAEALGASLRAGALGASRVLRTDTTEYQLSAGVPTYVEISRETGARQLRTLAEAPVGRDGSLLVPLDFLRDTLGTALSVEFVWDGNDRILSATRRVARQIDTSVAVVHQYRVSTVEITLSELPRYEVETTLSSLALRAPRDAWVLRDPPGALDDPLVRRVRVDGDRLVIDLAIDATATEPRLVANNPPRLVVDVYKRRSPVVDEPDPVEKEDDRPARRGVSTIVVDPGHGGSETGAIGSRGSIESQLTLQVARLLRTRLEQRMPVDVVLTRDADIDVPHDSRVALANENKADLFVSLHFNSYAGRTAKGAETYFLSREASDRVAAEAVARENQYATGGNDELPGLELILWDLAQSHHLAESQRFATLVQEELNQALGLRDRGVRQAPFRVLMGADMPAVLVELGFLSNPDEEAKLGDGTYLRQLADALVRAIQRFERVMLSGELESQDEPPGTSPQDEEADAGSGDPVERPEDDAPSTGLAPTP